MKVINLSGVALALTIASGTMPAPVLSQTVPPNQTRALPSLVPQAPSDPAALNQMPSDRAASANQVTPPLKPGDQLRILVAGFQELSGDQVIMSDGMIQMPMVGAVRVAGLTPNQTVALLTNALMPYVRRPQVAISLLSLSPLRVSIVGEVLHPGPRLFNPVVQQNPTVPQNNSTGSGIQSSSPTRVSDVLSLAGGVTPEADLRNIIIRRPTSASGAAASSREAAQNEIKVDLWNVVQSGDLSADVRVYDGDEVVVPRVQLANADQQTLLNSTIAPTNITVQVAGEVNRPGPVQIAATMRGSEAVAAAGGPTDKADRRAIELFRMSSEGQLEHQTFTFGDASIPLRNGDLLVVKKTNSDGFLDTLGRIISPLAFFLTLF